MQEEQNRQVSQQQEPNHQPTQPAQNGANDDFKENIDNVYDVEGLLAGGAAGAVVGILVSFDMIFAAEIGMFIGLIIGTRFKKNKK